MDRHRAYFENQLYRDVPEFWRRFGARPSCAGKRVLDLGCGHGAMCLELASEGAEVLGVDLNDELIRWAQEHVEPRAVSGRLKFVCEDVRKLPLLDYDFVISKDSFEHIDDLGAVLRALRDGLASGGRIWAGFSPLFYSPWGDHRATAIRLPWVHTLPRRFYYAAASARRGTRVQSLADLGLNGMTPAEFRRFVAEAGLRFDSLSYNVSDKRLMAVMSRLRRIAALERFATVSIYTVLAPA